MTFMMIEQTCDACVIVIMIMNNGWCWCWCVIGLDCVWILCNQVQMWCRMIRNENYEHTQPNVNVAREEEDVNEQYEYER